MDFSPHIPSEHTHDLIWLDQKSEISIVRNRSWPQVYSLWDGYYRTIATDFQTMEAAMLYWNREFSCYVIEGLNSNKDIVDNTDNKHLDENG